MTKSDKRKALIFGAGRGGYFAGRTLRKRFEIVGFLDNSATLQGSKLLGLPILSPDELGTVEFDLIAIASMYRDDIYYQLVDLGIDEDRIEIVDPDLLDGRYALDPLKVLILAIGLGLVAFGISVFA